MALLRTGELETQRTVGGADANHGPAAGPEHTLDLPHVELRLRPEMEIIDRDDGIEGRIGPGHVRYTAQPDLRPPRGNRRCIPAARQIDGDPGMVEFIDNPAHRRSKLVRITPEGEARLKEVSRRIEQAYEKIAPGLDEASIRQAIDVLSELRRRLAEF